MSKPIPDLALFEDALRQHHGAMLHFFMERTNGDFHLAEDLSQILWDKVHRYFEPDHYTTLPLLYSKAKQVLYDHYRHENAYKRPKLEFTDDYKDYSEGMVMPARVESIETSDEQQLFNDFWRLFHPAEYEYTSKIIFWLHCRYGFTMEEVGKKLNIAKSTAHDKLKAIARLCREDFNKNNPNQY